MPPVRLAPRDELAAAARVAPLLRAARDLSAWADAHPEVPPRQVLDGSDARAAADALELTADELDAAWQVVAAASELADNSDLRFESGLVPTPSARRRQAKQAGVPNRGQILRRDSPLAVGSRGIFAQQPNQIAGTGHQLRRGVGCRLDRFAEHRHGDPFFDFCRMQSRLTHVGGLM